MADTPQPVSDVKVDFLELIPLLIELGLVEPNSHLQSPEFHGRILSVIEPITSDGLLPTPFPLGSNSIGTVVLSKHPEPIEQRAEQTLNSLLSSLVHAPLSELQRVGNRPLLNALKSFNLLRLVCTTAMLRYLTHARGHVYSPHSNTRIDSPRSGRIGFINFLRKNPDIIEPDSESCEQAYALEHSLNPDIAAAMRAGIIRREVLLSPEGLRRAREGDPSVVAFPDEDALIAELKMGNTACIISYRHVMHENEVTGLCQEQLDSVKDRLLNYEFVWLDTVYSRSSRKRWAPACVTLFGILDCLATSEALRQRHRTWIKAENILSTSKQDFWLSRSQDHFYTTKYEEIQLDAAQKIAEGALDETESLFAIDKEQLIEWACGAYTCPLVELTGVLTLQEGHLETMAAVNHFIWSAMRSPYIPKSVLQYERLLSPEQAIMNSVDLKALKCNVVGFVLRLLMRLEDRSHCFYDAEERRVYVLLGDVGDLGSRLFVYEDVSVSNKGLWMRITAAGCMKEYCLTCEDMLFIGTGMAVNSRNQYDLENLEPVEGRPDEVVLDDIIRASSYNYVCRSKDVSSLADREKAHSHYDFSNCLAVSKQLVNRMAAGICYRKLATTYFGFWDSIVIPESPSIHLPVWYRKRRKRLPTQRGTLHL